MEPKQSTPNFAPSPEQMTPIVNYESLQYGSPEQAGERAPERQVAAPVETASQPPAIPVLPSPVQAQMPEPVATPSDVPTIANDDDIIEKEWVNQTKQVLAATKDDPYRRELEVGKLQRDYIYKRYGRKIGGTGEE